MRRVQVLVLLMFAGCGDERIRLSDESALVAKCTFGEGNESIEPGDPFLYVFEGAEKEFSAFTSVGRVSESLREHTTGHEVDLVEPAELNAAGRLSWGSSFVSMSEPDGEIHTAIGTIEGSEDGYPRCFYWAR